MNRNVESHFALNPTSLDMSRSQFDRQSRHLTSFNVGQLIPFYVDPVYPGDTFDVTTSWVVRLQTLLTPMMDNIYLDTYFFFVPSRLCWEHWKEFMGEASDSAWLPKVEYEEPEIQAPADTGFEIGTIASYMGIPAGVPNLRASALPIRAYALICNEWFRDENLMDPLVIPKNETLVTGVNTGDYVTDVAKGGKPFVAGKFRDYFTSCLPSPQRGPDVTIPVASGAKYPVLTGEPHLDNKNGNPSLSWATITQEYVPPASPYGLAGTGYATVDKISLTSQDNESVAQVVPANLWAVDVNPTAATINQLRLAFQIQKLYEKDARGGSRYISVLKSHFGVTSPDARMQRPEYLGGTRVPISVAQIVQQSASQEGQTPQGTPVGLSLTVDTNGDFIHSFTEHGYVIGVCVARYDHTYQQGLERFWSRKSRFDYYWPVFANIGEQAVKNKEIFAQGTAEDDEVFGYQEAWADLRYKPNRVSGEMLSAAPQSLDVWHLADDYETLPKLSADWIREDPNNVDRVLAVTSENANQIFLDVMVNNRTTRVLPMYSIPGLIDHH